MKFPIKVNYYIKENLIFMKYLKLFKSEDEYNTYKTDPDYITPNVCLVKNSTQENVFPAEN